MNRFGRILGSALPALAALPLLSTVPLYGQVGGGSTLRGRVTNSAGQALPGALVIRSGITADTARADSTGRYFISRLALGRHVFVVRHPGYETVEMEVGFPIDTVFEVDVPLTPGGAAAVSSGSMSAKLDSVGFTRRRRAAEERRARGVFFGPEELSPRSEGRTSQLLEGLRDIRVRLSGRYQVVYGDGGRCVLDVWIDGNLARDVYPSGSLGLDEIIQVRELAAVEVYTRNSQVPLEFRSAMTIAGGRGYQTRTVECGAILFWRR